MFDSPLDLAFVVTLWASVGGFAMSHAVGELVVPPRRTGLVAVVVFATISIIAVPASALGLRRVSPRPGRPAPVGGSHDPEAHQRPVQEP